MKKQEFNILLSSAVTVIMALIMTWINLSYSVNYRGAKFAIMALLLPLWFGAWMYHHFPFILIFRHAIVQSLGVAMGLWAFAAGELAFRLVNIKNSVADWIVLGFFSVVFLWIVMTGGDGINPEEPQSGSKKE